MINFSILKLFIPAALTFVIGILGTPLLTRVLYRYQLWKKKSVSMATDGGETTLTQKLHDDANRHVPRMGGIVVWGSVCIVIGSLALAAFFFPGTLFARATFLSRNQTILPLATLIVLSLIGMFDDYLVCRESGTYKGGGLALSVRIAAVIVMSLVCGLWFYFKLHAHTITLPFLGVLHVGILFVFIFMIVMVATYAGGIIDGVDGLAGGVFAIIYGAFAFIAYSHGQIDIAAFCMAIVGGLLAFLWFNIPPARFFLSETGTMGLTATLVVVAFLTNSVAVLPIVGFLLYATAASSLIQILSKRFRHGKRVFLVAPLHNHFQALGWPASKVTMRYWIMALFCALIGILMFLSNI